MDAQCVLYGVGTEFWMLFTYMSFDELKALYGVIMLTSAKAIVRVSVGFDECCVG
jgi:hypothetical protein